MDPRRLGWLGAVAILTVLLLWSFQPPAWNRQLQDSTKAVAKARSYRSRELTRQKDGMQEVLFDVACGSGTRQVIHMLDENGDAKLATETEVVTVPGRRYIRSQDHWNSLALGSGSFDNCKYGPGTGALEFPSYREISAAGFMKKSDSKTMAGVECREWEVQMGGRKFTICFDDDAHPLEFRAADGSYTATFSDWNVPVTIQAPEVH